VKPDDHGVPGGVGHRAQLGDRPVPLGDDALGAGQQRPAGIGQRDAAVPAREQLGAQPGLQAAHLLGQRGLGDEQGLGGAGETHCVGHGEEVTQIPHVRVARS
jgi:hypothetical protein